MTDFLDHFAVVDEHVGPQPWAQLRCVASGETESVSKTYSPTGLQLHDKNDLLQELTVTWTNDTPITHHLYGIATKSGSRVTLQCRSRGYLQTSHGLAVDGTPTLAEVSRFGVGTDVGKGGILKVGGAYAISELRHHSTSYPFMPHVTGWWSVEPGETVTAQVEVRFISEFWENTLIDGGDGDTESSVVTGDLRLDLFAVPSMLTAGPRTVPTVVGTSYDREVDLGFADTIVSVNLPSGVQAGDTLLAIVCNQFGLAKAITPIESGWTLLHECNTGLRSIADVHMKVWIRTATSSEPAHYQFENGLLAEETAVLVAVRGASPLESSDGQDWHVASTLSKAPTAKLPTPRQLGDDPDPNSPTLFTACGTSGSTVEAIMGSPTGLADVMVGMGVDPALWNWHPIDYRGAVLGVESFINMEDTAADGTADMIAAIQAWPGKFAICGTSQGAIVCSNVYDEIRSGSLQSRQDDFLGGVVFGNPRRQTGFTIPDGTDPGGSTPTHGVMRDDLLTGCDPDLWWDFANSGDLVADVGDDPVGVASSAIFQFMLGNYVGQGSIIDEVWDALHSSLGLTLQTVYGLVQAFADTMVLSLQWVFDMLAGRLGAPESWAVGAHLQYHLAYTNLPGNTKSAVRLAVEHLNPIGEAAREGVPVDSARLLVADPAAPSIQHAGQLLLCASFFSHALSQSPITQTPPDGMTELVDLPGAASTLSIAKLDSPPNPTKRRHFTPSEVPQFSGHSITASILVPGTPTYI